jgi:glyceraldehyde 3-phosphate dehydrogenase
MAVKIGINGFGRIGRYMTRIMMGDPDVELAVINARADNQTLAHLLKYDSCHGVFHAEVGFDDEGILLNKQLVRVTRENLGDWKWKDLGVDIAIETSGKLKDRDGLQKHLDCGAKKAIISAPGKGVDITVVMGVNQDDYDPSKHHVLSNASCTTNCLAPAVKVLNDAFGFKHGLMTTIHSYTMSQRILDGSHKDLRRARAAAMNMIPTTTGAAKAVTEVIPALKGKLDGMAVRVPTPNVSMVDLTCELNAPTDAATVNAALKAAAEGPLKGAMCFTDLPLVSTDFMGSECGGVIDGQSTTVIDKTMLKVLIWYDNESGFSHQLLRLVKMVAKGL